MAQSLMSGVVSQDRLQGGRAEPLLAPMRAARRKLAHRMAGRVNVCVPGLPGSRTHFEDEMTLIGRIKTLFGGSVLSERNFKKYRSSSLDHALAHARRAARGKDQTFSAVHWKNLIQLIEAAPLENEKSEVSEIWGRLFRSGRPEFDAQLAAFADSMKRMGNDEVAALRALVLKCSRFPEIYPDDVRTEFNERAIRRAYLSREPEMTEDKFKAFCQSQDSFWDGHYCHALIVDEDIKQGSSPRAYLNGYFDRFDAYQVLQRENLVTIKRIEIPYGEKQTSILYVEATRLGIGLMARCFAELAKPKT